jgi:site-specific recombinase XerD
MSAWAAALRAELHPPPWPSGIARYDRRTGLSAAERDALSAVAASRNRWPAGAALTLARLTEPVDDVLAFVTPRAVWRGRSPSRAAVLAGIAREEMVFWGWERDQWIGVLRATHPNIRQVFAAVGYLLCDQRDLHRDLPGFKLGLFARRVLGAAPVDVGLARVQSHIDTLGSSALLRRPNLQHALYRLMVTAGSAQLEDCAQPELLVEMRDAERNNARRHGIEQLARTLVDLGVLARMPFSTQPSREGWLDRSRAGEIDVPAEWLGWVKRWFETATLSAKNRQATYFMLIKAGRWITLEAPELADPRAWTRESAARWVARVDRLLVGEFSHAPNTDYMRRRHGETLSPRSKASQIWALRRFFNDLHEWEWIERRFDPRRAFEIPRSLRALIGPDPRVISDDIWAKLMWAGLNLKVEDLPSHGRASGEPWYPLEFVRAVAMLWLFAGLRTDEIYRLRVGAIRWQPNHADDDRSAVCLLDVPVNKTATPFTKPVDRLVGEAIEAWQTARPPQPRFPDRKTGQPVDVLFAFRGAQIGHTYVNRVLLPLLPRKAGVPRQDVRGQITGHRARATIASQLYNAKDPMTLFELQAWLGHSCPSSTQHYARITPTKLTKAYTDAGYFARNIRTIEVLLDRDAITTGQAGNDGPFEFYDLGHGYCTYSFFEQCPHRMACARCDFYLPKPSSETQLLEAKDGLQRMLVQIPLTDDERAAVEGDEQAVDRLLNQLADTPTPAGSTPRTITQPTRTALPVLRIENSRPTRGAPETPTQGTSA